MVVAKVVKAVMRLSQLAISFEKRRIMRDSLVQQIGRLKQFGFPGTAETCQKKIFGARVEIESSDVARRRTFDCIHFTWRKLGLKLPGNRFRDLALNREHIRK